MKKIKYLITVVLIYILGCNIPYKYNVQKTIEFATINANSRSKCMCAWYVMRALHSGGCYPCGIYPAYAYQDILPKLGYVQVTFNDIQRGDICVLGQNSKSKFGHIAIYNGRQWISDFTQKSLYPNQAYRNESTVRFYRQTNGWHTANIWASPVSIVEYINVLVNNYQKISL